jgi:hypothetical protein
MDAMRKLKVPKSVGQNIKGSRCQLDRLLKFNVICSDRQFRTPHLDRYVDVELKERHKSAKEKKMGTDRKLGYQSLIYHGVKPTERIITGAYFLEARC